MPTRRPKVPKAGSAGNGAAGGTASGRGGTKPVRRRSPAADPDTISATKPVDGAGNTEPAGEKTLRAAGTPKAAPGKAAPGTTAAKPAAAKAPAKSTPAKSTPAKSTAAKAAPAKAAPAAKAPAGRKADSSAAAAGRFRRRIQAQEQSPGTPGGAAGETAADDLRPVPAKAFSGRLLVLAMVTLVITVLLAPSVNTYLHQRSDIAALEADIAAEKETSRNLESELERWEDPNYIKQQARERIFLVMPGETRYLVKGEHGVEEAEQQAQEEAEDLQWVDSLWDSVKRAATAP